MKVILNDYTIQLLKNSKTIGERIRIVREELQKLFPESFNGKAVSKRVNVSISKLYFIEGETTKSVDAEMLYKISLYFGVSIYAFLDDKFFDSVSQPFYLEPEIFKDNNDVIELHSDAVDDFIIKDWITKKEDVEIIINIKRKKED